MSGTQFPGEEGTASVTGQQLPFSVFSALVKIISRVFRTDAEKGELAPLRKAWVHTSVPDCSPHSPQLLHTPVSVGFTPVLLLSPLRLCAGCRGLAVSELS